MELDDRLQHNLIMEGTYDGEKIVCLKIDFEELRKRESALYLNPFNDPLAAEYDCFIAERDRFHSHRVSKEFRPYTKHGKTGYLCITDEDV